MFKYDICIVGLGINSIYLYYLVRNKFKNILILEKHSNVEETYNNIENVVWDTPTDSLLPLKYNNYVSIPSENHLTSKQIGVYLNKLFNKIKLNNTKIIFNTEIEKITNINNVCLLESKNQRFFAHKVILCIGWNIKTIDHLISHEISKPLNYIKYLYNNINIKNKTIVLIGAHEAGVEFITKYLCENKIIWIIKSKHQYESEPNKIKPFSHRLRSRNKQKKFLDIINLYKNNLTIYRSKPKIFYEKKIVLENNIVLDNFDYCIVKIGYSMKNNKLIKNSNIQMKDDWIYCKKKYTTNIKNVFIFGSCLSNSYKTNKPTRCGECFGQGGVHVRDQNYNANNLLKLLLNN